jgi:hypothetical protein
VASAGAAHAGTLSAPSAPSFLLLPEDRLSGATATVKDETAPDDPVPPCDDFQIHLAGESPDGCVPAHLAAADADIPEAPGETAPASPGSPHKLGWSYAVFGGVVAGALLNTLSETPHQSFHFTREHFFGETTYAGGADKASHFVDYFIIAKEMGFLYESLGYTREESLAFGAGLALLAGVINESGDGINRYGFSYEDLVMDASGAVFSTLVSLFKANDLIGARHGFLLPPYSVPAAPGSVGTGYSSQIYTVDLKLGGLAKRLDVDAWPLRYLLVSVTYGSKGYGSTHPELRERQVGFEIGLNVEEILNSLGVTRANKWGYAAHFVLDNLRLPFTSLGVQYDLNHGKWYGPGNGNGYATP